MKSHPASRWQKQTLKLKDKHTWSAPPGYNVFVADRGAVRFNFPQSWIVGPAKDCIELRDKEQPDDNCRLAVSYLRLPPVDWTGLPLSQLLSAVTDKERRDVLSRGEIVKFPRKDLEIAWTEIRFMDANERREAFSRIALARGSNLQALITFDYWVDDDAKMRPVWEEVMRSVELGRYVKDPTRGHIVH